MKKTILLFYLLFGLFGLICLLSASSPYESEKLTGDPHFLFFNQFAAFVISLVCLLSFSIFDYRLLQRGVWILGLLSLVCLLLVQFSKLGILAGGSKRWLNLGLVSFQPSEISKISVIALVADALSKEQLNKIRWKEKLRELSKLLIFLVALLVSYLSLKDLSSSFNIIVLISACFVLVLVFKQQMRFFYRRVALVLLLISLVLKQPDLGTSLLLLATCFFLLFLNGLSFLETITLGGAFSFLFLASLKFNAYQYERVQAWLNPEDFPLDAGYNLIQSYYAIARGGLWGVGYGSSEQKLGYLPVAYSDFVYSIVCEELGLIGAILIVGAFLLLLWKSFDLLLKTREKFGKILGLGLIFCICSQAIFNLTGVTGLLPITGITLPFVSYGKSSLITLGIMIGIIISIIRKDAQLGVKQPK